MSTKTQTWNPSTHEDYDRLKGMDVFTSDDEKIGTVDEVLHPANDSTDPQHHYFHVDPGMLDKIVGEDDMYVRATEVKFISDDRVMLGMSKDGLKSGNWSGPRDIDTFRRR